MSSSDDLKFAILNIRSLPSKSFYINNFISQYDLHFLFLTECWLSSTASATLIEASPPDYSVLFSARQGKKGGGIATIFSNLFTSTECTFGEFSTFEYLAMVIRTGQNVLALPIYRPPKHNPYFLTEFSELSSLALVKYDRVILLGDFNLHINDSSDSRAVDFMGFVTRLNFTQHVKNATHNRGNTLDLIFTKGIDANVSSILQVPVSDHSCVFFNVSLCRPLKCSEPDTYTYYYYHVILTLLLGLCWLSVYPISLTPVV